MEAGEVGRDQSRAGGVDQDVRVRELPGVLHAHAAEPDAAEVEVRLCGMGEQGQYLRDGRADAALTHRPFDSLAGFGTEDLLTEEQVVVLPAGHPLAARTSLSLAEVSDVPGLPMARWPNPDGSYPPGPGPEIHDQSQLAQTIALGRALAVICESARAWLWSGHVAVPLVDATQVTTVLAWPPHSRSRALAGLVRTATRL
ncbi:LysR substrate-binding domain-containing protein [Actinophytocola gossypii]|uniref:LysR substrate-binding domain-containing protein n=1 Tax=Actinophytocola gossypii TaxID=2812003 RepID=UPI00288353FE|nr:LysR substrate-binding domain-containing protein [Actinophytocola gossypii]